MKIEYRVPEHDSERIPLEVRIPPERREKDLMWVAETAAMDFFDNHGGWECTWPLYFEIYINSELVSVIHVGCEMNPVFNASL